MPSPTVYDPDSVEFPLADPKLRLSVSAEEYKPKTGLKLPLDIYAERFDLDTILKTEINNNVPTARAGIFAYNLNLSGGTTTCGFAFPGANGDSTHKNGFNGGDFSLYVEELMPSTTSRLSFSATGGKGYTPPDKVGVKGEAGGNGGSGGHVKILFDTLYTSPGDTAAQIYKRLNNDDLKWPSEFRSDATAFVKLLATPEVKATKIVDKLPSWAKTVEGILDSDKTEFMAVIQELYKAVRGSHDQMQGDLTQAADVLGGERGSGSTGEGVTGDTGNPGDPGQRVVQPIQNRTGLLQRDVCFAHPMQCQMMLAKVDTLRFSGTDADLNSASSILDRLMHRLAVFASPQKAPEPRLWAAYRNGSARLFTVENGLSTTEPYAIRRLRAIRSDAETTKQKILSGEGFAGINPKEIPRGEFSFYQDTTKTQLAYLKDFEDLFLQYFQGSKDAAAKLADVQKRSEVLDQSSSMNDGLIKEANEDLTETTRKIGLSVDAIAKVKKKLLDAMTYLDDFVDKQFGVSFQDFVAAMNSVLFTGGNWAMIGLQTANLIDQGREKLLQDDDVAVKKSFLISKLHDLEGGVKELTQKYEVLQNEHIVLDDPGADKILMAEKAWETLVKDFRRAMNSADYEDVKKKFEDFYNVVKQRNTAVLHYNAILTLLLDYCQKREQLNFDRLDIKRQEYSTLDAGHPAMTGFLKKIYRDNVYLAQVWLYRQQQALRFLSLKKVTDLNVIGDALHNLPYSQLDHGTLERIQATLFNNHKDYLVILGQSAQTQNNLRVYLSDDDVGYIKLQSSCQDISLSPLTIRIDDSHFNEHYDVRLSTVRFYLVGAKLTPKYFKDHEAMKDPSNKELQVSITHTGTEWFRDRKGDSVQFTHLSLTVLFRYALPETDQDTGVIKSDGTIALNKDMYARVGPFTDWRVDILRESNKFIDLSNVSDAYFEFDFQYHGLRGGNN